MESPRCKICGQRHYGVCKVGVSPSALREMVSHAAPPAPEPIAPPPPEPIVEPPVVVPVKAPVVPAPKPPVLNTKPPVPDAWEALLSAARSGDLLSMPIGDADKLVWDAMAEDTARHTIARIAGLYIAHGHTPESPLPGRPRKRKLSHAEYMRDWRKRKQEEAMAQG